METKLIGRKFFAINREGVKYESGAEGVLIAQNDDEVKLFKLYGFEELIVTEKKGK